MKRSREEYCSDSDADGNNNNNTEELQQPLVKQQIIQSSVKSCSFFQHGKICYENEDYVKALELFQQGVEGECPECSYGLGNLYYYGLGVKQDCKKGLELFLKAIEGGFCKPLLEIGLHYFDYEEDYSKAIEWFLKASENGDAGAQLNVGACFEEGLGVQQDYSKAMEWYLKSIENGCVDGYFNIGLLYESGLGVEKDYSKAMEWYFKSAEKGDKQTMVYLGGTYWNGELVKKNIMRSVFWHTKSVNDTNFVIVENPYDQFAIEAFISNYENTAAIDEGIDHVIIRFKERDFRVPTTYLYTSTYLTTMLNSNWRDFNEKEENLIILDLRSIQEDILPEPSDPVQIFECYINFLETNETMENVEMEVKIIEMARYLGDYECILRIVNNAPILMRFYILQKFDLIEPLHIAIASCFTMEQPSLSIEDLSENMIEMLLSESEITAIAKNKILQEFVNKFKKFPNSTNFSNKILHTTLSLTDNHEKELNFNNQLISFRLESFKNNNNHNISKITCSHNLELFGSNAKYYIQLTMPNHSLNLVGFWLENSPHPTLDNTIFQLFHDFELINLVIIT